MFDVPCCDTDSLVRLQLGWFVEGSLRRLQLPLISYCSERLLVQRKQAKSWEDLTKNHCKAVADCDNSWIALEHSGSMDVLLSRKQTTCNVSHCHCTGSNKS